MREINKIAESLFEKVRDRFEDVTLGDQNAKATNTPEDARFFNFDYVIDNKNYGNITISIIDENSLKVYYSKNISNNLEEPHKQKWYSFLKELREFSKRNLLNFEPRDITRSTLKYRDIEQQSHADTTYSADELVSEGKMYGTKKRSYESYGPVRIKIQHTKEVAEEIRGSRSRNIEAIFIENEQNERFRLPFTNLLGARAMARHISAGGLPTDTLGEQITLMVNEMITLRPFVHSMRTRTLSNESAQQMAESAFGYHRLLKSTLNKMKGKRGYNEYKENFNPQVSEDEIDVSSLKDLFVRKIMDERVENALPLVHKAHKIMSEKDNTLTKEFESWANRISEGTWNIPETDQDIKGLAELLRKPIIAGVDGMNATNAVGKYIGDDSLYDDIEALAEVDPEADCNSLIVSWLDNNMPEVLEQIKELSPDGFVRDQGRDKEENYRQPGFNNPRKYTDDLGIMGKNKEEKPKDWAQAVAADESVEEDKEYECPTCQGAGEWRDEEHKKHDCPDCDGEGKYVDVDDLEEGKMKDLSMDLKDLSDKEFEEKYGMKKSDWEEVKTPGLRQDPSKPAYISKNLIQTEDEEGPLDKVKDPKAKIELAKALIKNRGQANDDPLAALAIELTRQLEKLEKENDWEEKEIAKQAQTDKRHDKAIDNLQKSIHEDEIVVYEAHEKLEKLVGQRVYVKDKGQTGTVAQVSNTHSNALVVDMDNGQTTVTHFTDLTSEDDKPNTVKRYLDMLKDIFDLHGKGPTPKGGLPAKSWDTLGEEELSDIKRLSGLK